jgi:hypothetical protein
MGAGPAAAADAPSQPAQRSKRTPAALATPVTPLSGRAYNATALALEARIQREVNAPLRVSFHRKQAFEGGPAAARWRVLSVAWQREDGGASHCVLAVMQGAEQGTEQTNGQNKQGQQGAHDVHVDALAGERDEPPWSCDGEPALRIRDLDNDGCPEVIALYPMRPPSGERFTWPLVLRCDGARADPTWALDTPRTQRLRSAVQARPIQTLRQAEALLRAAPGVR